MVSRNPLPPLRGTLSQRERDILQVCPSPSGRRWREAPDEGFGCGFAALGLCGDIPPESCLKISSPWLGFKELFEKGNLIRIESRFLDGVGDAIVQIQPGDSKFFATV